VPGHLGRLKPGRKSETYIDQRYNPAIISSKTYRGFPFYMGNEFGLPDDIIDLLNIIWGMNNVLIDGKSFAALGEEFDFVETDKQAKRGVKIDVVEGINRRSKVITQTVDPTKKLFYAIMVDAKVFGDTSNQGSSNTVPIITVE
jgi:hypothetical protein